MAILTVFLQVLLVIVSILLVGVILLQRNKGAGAGVTFGGMSEAFGADAGNVLTVATVTLGSLFLLLTIGLSVITTHTHRTQTGSVMDNVKIDAPAVLPELPATTAETPVVVPEVTDEAATEIVADEEMVADEVAEEAPAAEIVAPAEEPSAEPVAEVVAEPAAPVEVPTETPAVAETPAVTE